MPDASKLPIAIHSGISYIFQTAIRDSQSDTKQSNRKSTIIDRVVQAVTMGLTKLQKRIGFIGAGQMAEALARGFISKGVIEASSMIATDPVAARREVFESFDVRAVTTNVEVTSHHRNP